MPDIYNRLILNSNYQYLYPPHGMQAYTDQIIKPVTKCDKPELILHKLNLSKLLPPDD